MRAPKILLAAAVLLMVLIIPLYMLVLHFIDYMHSITPKALYDVDYVFLQMKVVVTLVFIVLAVTCLFYVLWCTSC
ncbi:MAG: hypothetical protein QW599_05445 [Nitrososphaerota archaeon]